MPNSIIDDLRKQIKPKSANSVEVDEKSEQPSTVGEQLQSKPVVPEGSSMLVNTRALRLSNNNNSSKSVVCEALFTWPNVEGQLSSATIVCCPI